MPEAPPTNRFAHLTPEQQRAICTVGHSLLVSAAAGAGKTTVLAERCAYLVCDLPPGQQCDIDQLLVVTFTDAAAGEMRTRIRNAIQQRRKESPPKDRLDRQLHLLESASISTIHSFCKSLIQQWFPHAGVDPQAAVLAEDEADLLRHEVLDALLVELYGSDEEHGLSFQSLVDDYGAGDDHAIAEAVLYIHDFAASLPDPDGWLEQATKRLDTAGADSLVSRIDELQCERLSRELEYQIEQAVDFARIIERIYPAAAMHSEALKQHASQCEAWLAIMKAGGPRTWEAVAGGVKDHKIATGRKPNKNRISEKENAEFDAAKNLIDRQRDFFDARVKDAICRFTADEYREGLARILPCVRTIVRMVKDFGERYQDAKAAQAAVDFNDLQRHAYKLLTDKDDPTRPSDVARQLQRRYRHVLVDEFQDVDPLQEAILRFVSREQADPLEGNLFAVGDIKQSIYRFRLAEPRLFSRRADEFARGSPIGELIPLQHNFRSHEGIIDAVNLFFTPLMSRSFGGSDYDDKARLRAKASYLAHGGARTFDRPAVEVHLLEPIAVTTAGHTQSTEQEANSEAPSSGPDTEDLEGIEREACLIAHRIRDWMGIEPAGQRVHVADKPATPSGPPTFRPIEYRDIVILLRSMPHKAEPIANILRRMGIPVLIGRGESGADSTEWRDILSLLRVLDNRQQDVPLAALLRSPLTRPTLTETDLLRIRLHNREVPFHEAVIQYARQGADADIRGRLAGILATLDRWRTRIRRAPVAEVLWEILEETRYPAFVAGLPDGHRRLERLIQFHDLAREFGQFRRQGLRRFLRFVDEVLEDGDSPARAVGAGGSDNAVRIMTVHTSKGLEFPVVILADLAKPFNLSDIQQSILVHRDLGIALLAADPDRRIYYPTLIHQLAADDHRRENLSEELRVLYVALTRAREHLGLIGRVSPNKVAAFQVPRDSSAGLPRLQLETAGNCLNWLLAAAGAAPSESVRWPGDEATGTRALVEVREYPRIETDKWQIPPAIVSERVGALARLASLNPLPNDEPLGSSDEAGQLVNSLDMLYPNLELTTLTARVSVTELKRRWESSSDPDFRPTPPSIRAETTPLPAFTRQLPAAQAANRGIATHRFCQLIDLARPCDAADLAAQHQELLEAGRLTPAEAEAVLVDSITWFLSSPLGQHVREAADKVRREIAFVSRIAPDRYDPMAIGQDSRDVLLLRGTIDLLICHQDRLEIIDFKTDAVTAGQCPARAEAYRPQLDSYAEAAHGIYHRPVSRRWLVFLQPRCIIDLSSEST
jgi:ATP-dependent helicase/nuclease subunit A